MASKIDHETNLVKDEYCGEDEDDLGGFIVHDDEDLEMENQKQHHQQGEYEDDLGDFIDDDDEDLASEKQKQHQQLEEEVEEEEEEEEEAPVGVQEILSLREKLKEKIRKRNAAMAGGAGRASCSSSAKQTPPPAKDRFGTFFGPSRPAFALRVIQEGCSSMMKELHNAPSSASLVPKAQKGNSGNPQKPKFVSEEKKKVDALRENRDYSSLFSDDAEAPPPAKEQLGNGRPALVPKPDVRGPVSSSGKNGVCNGQPARLSSGHGLMKGAAPSIQARVQSNKAGSPGKGPPVERKRTVPAARNGSTPPAMKKATGLQPSSNGQRLTASASVQIKRSQGPLPVKKQHQSFQAQKLQPASQNSSNARQLLLVRRPASSAHGQLSGQNGSAESHGRPKSAQKQLVASSKLKASRPVEKRAVKRETNDQSNYVLISKEIGEIFGYDRSKYAGRDEDDRNMEADYASILKEERRSAKLARQEDEEQLRLIEEEERRERAKKRKKQPKTEE